MCAKKSIIELSLKVHDEDCDGTFNLLDTARIDAAEHPCLP